MIPSIINVQSVLVEHAYGGKVYANSGCLIDNKFILITANVLVPLLNESKSDLRSIPFGLLNPLRFFDKPPKLTIIIKNEDSRSHQYKEALVVAAYVSEITKKSVSKYLYDWAIDVDGKEDQLKESIPIFFIASFNFKNAPNANELLDCLKRLKLQSLQTTLSAGNKVCIESTPFGNRHFLRSHSRGIISNVTGENDCFLLTDVPVAPGSEGSPVYTKFGNDEIPIGMVLSCMSWWKGEWIGLTLVASFKSVFNEILSNTTFKIPLISEAHMNETIKKLNTNVAQITSGMFWGTAILLNKENGIFITNSHVIENDSPVLHYKETNIKATVIYKAKENQIFDIAILRANQHDLDHTDMVSVKLSPKPMNLGDNVFALGFPLFPRHTKPKATLTNGHVSQVSKTMLKTTCTVLPGASGGGIFDKNGELVGIIVCNAKMEDSSTTYPRVNMAIPISRIYDDLIEFLTKKGEIATKRVAAKTVPRF
nr:peroxisomal leader peptide-processing protease [Onthophagus taurus]